MNLFETVKASVSVPEAAKAYGLRAVHLIRQVVS